ncbi:MAG: radical SAM protein [bacterium]|nr:radical SAM protein [bacterium]
MIRHKAASGNAPGCPRRDGVELTVRAGSFGAVAESEPGPYVRIDAEGRWTAFGEQGVCYRRTVDGKVVRHDSRGFVECQDRELLDVDTRAWGALQAFASAVGGEGTAALHVVGERADLERQLQAGANWTPARLAEARACFARAYPEPAEILPPHRYRDLVLLPATGCPNGTCTFCSFYRNRRFRPLSDDAFEAHLMAVRTAFGAALAERDGVFLGSASALSLSDAVLTKRLQRIRELFGPLRRGVASFLDPDRSPPRRASDWRRLKQLGLVETCVGLETGLPSLRAAVGKTASMDRVTTSVASQKDAGLGVSLTVLVGLGGSSQEGAHREATTELLSRMPLSASDTVYLSPLADDSQSGPSSADLAAWRRECRAATDARIRMYLVERFAWLS